MLEIKNLSVTLTQTETSPLVTNLTVHLQPGTVHALMGPNGSGKSSLALTIGGHPHYAITQGTITFNNTLLNECTPDKRAQLGLYLSLQHPPAIPGLTVFTLMTEAWRAHNQTDPDLELLHKQAEAHLALLGLPGHFLDRHVHDGFSGGEKKRLEMAIALLLKPNLLILDEIDSGLDVDALRLVAQAIKVLQNHNPQTSLLIITHYRRILDYILPDQVHVMDRGSIKLSGDAALVNAIEAQGYHEL